MVILLFLFLCIIIYIHIKMISLYDFITEKLSDKQINTILTFIDDNNYNDILTLLKRYQTKSSINTDKFTEFFNKHGISQLNWGRKTTAVQQFMNLFDENNNLMVLNSIVENDGVISVLDLPQTGNIYDYCKVVVNNKKVSFKTEAQEIATWVNGQSANAGPAEMLLKFILHEGTTGKSGDVFIRDNNNTEEEMEVKASTVGSKTPSGGHAAGQKGTIRKTWSIYYFLDKFLFNIDTTNSEADKKRYFQNGNGCSQFIEMSKDIDIETVAEKIVDSLCFQYNFISNDIIEKNTYDTYNNIVEKNTVPNRNKIIEQTVKLLKNDFSYDNIKNIIGVIQLYLYSIVEQFEYFIGILVAKEDSEKHKDSEGNYVLFKCPKNRQSELLEFSNVLKYFSFGALDSTTSTQGRTGKIYFNL